jgi:hypothetical protein
MRDICLKVLSWNLHGLAWPLSKDPGGLIQKQLVDLGFVPVCWMPQSDANRSPTKLADFQQRFLAFLNKRRKFRLYGASDGQNQKS